MYKRFNILLIVLMFGALNLISCGGSNTGKNDPLSDSIDSAATKGPLTVKLGGKLFSVPSPVQVAMLVKESNIPYNNDLLNKPSNQTNYTTTFKQALNLGVYGANLGYLNMYSQLPDAAKFFAVVKILSRELGILNSFNESTIKRIEANNNNKDSLIYIVSTLYRDADAYLMNNKRNDIGVLIIAGGWLESMYLMTQTLKTNKTQAIIDRIGEQKYPIDNLVDLLRPYYGKEGEEFDKFLEQLVDLATVFDGVTIEYKFEPPVTDEKTKTTVINSKTKTVITDYQLKTITESVAAIRNKIVE